jgi:hypothetical protein
VRKALRQGRVYPITTFQFPNASQLNHLLQLKQMQANLWEARSSREGAEETARQGNVCFTSDAHLSITHYLADPACFHYSNHHIRKSCFAAELLDSIDTPSSHYHLWHPSLPWQWISFPEMTLGT